MNGPVFAVQLQLGLVSVCYTHAAHTLVSCA